MMVIVMMMMTTMMMMMMMMISVALLKLVDNFKQVCITDHV